MISFSEWVQRQRGELDGRLWLKLSLNMAHLDTRIRREEYESALRSLPETYQLVDEPNLRGWRVLIHLIEGGLQLSATGDLNRVLDLAVRAVTTAEELKGKDHEALRLGSRLLLLRSWMKRDEVGYAEQVLAAGNEILEQGDIGHWRFWYRASNAWALWALKRDDEANQLLAEMLAAFPPASRHADGLEAKAYIAYRMRQTEEAAELYRQAAVIFDSDQLRHAAVRSTINHGICLFDSGLHEEAHAALEGIKPRLPHIMNPHYAALMNCFIGRNALAMEKWKDAIAPLEEALDLYKGRGWLRDETHITLDLMQARLKAGDKGLKWHELIAHARSLLSDLRSTDLQVRLDHMLAG